jgi:hypothetical protein
MALLLALFSSAVLLAADGPENKLALAGVIQDQSGAAIATAKVKVTATTSGAEFKTTTDEAGHFEFASLPEGEYLLSARAQGVEEGQMKVRVGPSPGRPVRLRLEIAEVKEEVTVTDDDFSRPSAQSNTDVAAFGRDWLANLPVKDGNPLAVPSLLINPALNGTGGPKLLVDGVETDSLDQPESSIRHIYVNKNPYAAEFGRPGKGRIEVTTIRRMRRKYHGTASTLFGNSALDARNAFAAVRPLQQRSISEAELDGPIVPGSRRASFLVAGRYESNNQSSVVAAQTLKGPFVTNVVAPERNRYLFGRLNFKIGQLTTLGGTYKFKDKSRENQGVKGFNLPERATDRLDQENEAKVFVYSIPGSVINEFRAAFRHRNQDAIGSTSQPAIVVLGAFNSGGAQIAERQRDTLASFEDIASLNKGMHTLRFGGGLRPHVIWTQDASNFGGTFSFSSLSDFAQQRPFLFTQNTGNPAINFSQHETYAFLEDEIRLRPNLSVVPGIRHQWQSNGNSAKNFAPRLALAYSPRGKQTVLRAGIGVFYDRQPESMQRQSLLEDGVRIRTIVITDPISSVLPGPLVLLPGITPSVMRIAPGIRFPYLVQGSLAVERSLGGQTHLSVEYLTVRGLKLYRTRDINAPLPGTTTRPNPGFVNIDQFESSGSSRGNSLTVTLQNRGGYKHLTFLAQYVLSRTTNDTSGLSSLPANNYDLRPERGRADFDQRHRFLLLGTYSAFWGLHLGGTLQVSSGPPFNITTGFDDNHDTVANDRPAGVYRNNGRGPGFAQLDMRLSKVVRFEKPRALQAEIAADAFNLLNNVNFTAFVGTLTSPFYGRANSAYAARQMQLSFRLRF